MGCAQGSGPQRGRAEATAKGRGSVLPRGSEGESPLQPAAGERAPAEPWKSWGTCPHLLRTMPTAGALRGARRGDSTDGPPPAERGTHLVFPEEALHVPIRARVSVLDDELTPPVANLRKRERAR